MLDGDLLNCLSTIAAYANGLRSISINFSLSRAAPNALSSPKVALIASKGFLSTTPFASDITVEDTEQNVTKSNLFHLKAFILSEINLISSFACSVNSFIFSSIWYSLWVILISLELCLLKKSVSSDHI
jgi:hypothetical protein